MSTVATPLSSTPIRDLLRSMHTPVSTYTTGAKAPAGAFPATVWQLMTDTRPLSALILAQKASAPSSYPVWSFCHRGDATPPADDLCLLMTFTPASGGMSPFTGRPAAVNPEQACVFVQIRAPRLQFALQGDVRRRAVAHLCTLWATLAGQTVHGLGPIAPPAPATPATVSWTIGSVPLLPDTERQLLLDQFSGRTENLANEVPLQDGETLPDVWARTVRAFPHVRIDWWGAVFGGLL